MRPFVPYLYSASDCIPLFRCRERREENINEPRRNECKIRDLDKRTSEGTNVRSENSGRVYGNIIPLSSSYSQTSFACDFAVQWRCTVIKGNLPCECARPGSTETPWDLKQKETAVSFGDTIAELLAELLQFTAWKIPVRAIA